MGIGGGHLKNSVYESNFLESESGRWLSHGDNARPYLNRRVLVEVPTE